VTNRIKRSISLPPEVSNEIDEAARAACTTPSAWITETARERLKIDEGLAGTAEWEALDGPRTPEQVELGRERAYDLLRRVAEKRASELTA
jgi:hypothetical protein